MRAVHPVWLRFCAIVVGILFVGLTHAQGRNTCRNLATVIPPVWPEQDEFAAERICYGNPAKLTNRIKWTERDGLHDTEYMRRFSFARPAYSEQFTLPLIIWVHPNGEDEDLQVRSGLMRDALDHGFAYMSLQSRHPTSSQKYYDPPAAPVGGGDGDLPPEVDAIQPYDIADLIQFARANAGILDIDPNNIFLVAQSRGSLSVLTSLMLDRQGDDSSDFPLYSSKPNAVFAAQAQVTYLKSELAPLFLKNFATLGVTADIEQGTLEYPSCAILPKFNYHCQFDKAVQTVTNETGYPLSALTAMRTEEQYMQGRPIWLRYDRSPKVDANGVMVGAGVFVNPAGMAQEVAEMDDPIYYNCFENLDTSSCLDLHHPNFGYKLKKNYLESLAQWGVRHTYVHVEYGGAGYSNSEVDRDMRKLVIAPRFFDNYYCFFMRYETADGVTHFNMTPQGNQQRVAWIEHRNAMTSDPDLPTSQCSLSELVAWNPTEQAAAARPPRRSVRP